MANNLNPKRRMKAVGGGKMVPKDYKDREDNGTQRKHQTANGNLKKGSAALSPREQQAKARRERMVLEVVQLKGLSPKI